MAAAAVAKVAAEPPCVSEFNRIVIADLLGMLVKKYPGDGNVSLLKSRLVLVKNESRSLLISEAGPIVGAYRAKLEARDETFFADINNLPEVTRAAETSPEDAATVRDLFDKIKNVYFNKCTQAERDTIFEKVKRLAKLNDEFVAATATVAATSPSRAKSAPRAADVWSLE